jgi:hypothetical protein
VLDVIAQGSGAPLHNQTFSQFPVSCAAGLAAIRQLKAKGLIERCAQIGEPFQRRLGELLDHPIVGDVRGRGLLAGIELVEDPESHKPFDRGRRIAEAVTEAAQAVGLVVWPSSGQADGTNGDLVMVAPPFIISEEEISELIHLLRIALDTATESSKA